MNNYYNEKVNFWLTYFERIKTISVCDCFIDSIFILLHDTVVNFFSLDKVVLKRLIREVIKKQKLIE